MLISDLVDITKKRMHFFKILAHSFFQIDFFYPIFASPLEKGTHT